MRKGKFPALRTYAKSSKILTPSKSVKYLGVHLDQHLNWKTHIASVATKLRRDNGALSKLRYFIPTKILLNVYHAIFASHQKHPPEVFYKKRCS